MFSKACLLGLLLAALVPAAFAGVYKWTDAAGRVHYGDVPKVGATALPIHPVPEPANAPLNGSGAPVAKEKSPSM